MYCSKCGEADQNVNSYCRKCGDFLHDNLSKFSLINKILGIENPQKQMAFGLNINIIAFAVSLVLLLFLVGYVEGAELATGKSLPNIIYLVCVFLGLIVVWQLISVIFSVNLMSKMRRVSDNVHQTFEEMQIELTNLETKDLLPPADLQSIIPSVVEVTTRNLEKVRRR
jgi:amino acid transporter